MDATHPQTEPSPGSPASRRKRGSAALPPTPTSDVTENRRKAPKVSRACDVCKAKKAKCTGTIPCSNCTKRGLACVYDAEYKRGRAPTPQPGSVARTRPRTGSLPQNGSTSGQTDSEHANTTSFDNARSRASPEMDMAEIGGQYLDPTSGLTFLHRAWRRLSAQSGQAIPDLLNGAEKDQRMMHAGDKPFAVDGSPVLPIPSRQAAMELMEFYFDVCVVTYRLLHRQTVTAWLRSVLDNVEHNLHVSHDIGHSKAAVILTILAIVTLRQEKLRNPSANGGWTTAGADQLFCASTSLTDTETGLPRLESAQARLLQVIYLLQTTRMNHAWYVFGDAVQIISALGLHRKAGRKRKNGTLAKSSSSDYIKDQCRKRTFWVAYIIDKYLSVVLGRPRYYHDDDIDQDFPDLVNDTDMTPQGRSASEPLEDCHVEALVLHAKLAQIIDQTSREVYSIAPSKTKDARVAAAQRLVRSLHDWRASLPPHLSTVRPATLVPSFRRQTAALKLAYSHAIMHASRPFLLGHTEGRDGEEGEGGGCGGGGEERRGAGGAEATGLGEAVGECLAAAKVALQTVDAMAGDGTLFHAFWWTYYVTFCALAVVYVWEIQQRSAGTNNAAGGGAAARDDGALRKLFDLAERCHAHLEKATAAESPNRRYSIILEELRLEAKHASSCRGGGGGGVGTAQCDVNEQGTGVPHAACGNTALNTQGFGTTVTSQLEEAALAQEGQINFEPMVNPLDQWETTDWLDLDSSAFEPFLDLGGSPVYSF